MGRKVKWQMTSDGRHKVSVGRSSDPEDLPQELVDHLGREFEREQRLWAKLMRQLEQQKRSE